MTGCLLSWNSSQWRLFPPFLTVAKNATCRILHPSVIILPRRLNSQKYSRRALRCGVVLPRPCSNKPWVWSWLLLRVKHLCFYVRRFTYHTRLLSHDKFHQKCSLTIAAALPSLSEWAVLNECDVISATNFVSFWVVYNELLSDPSWCSAILLGCS